MTALEDTDADLMYKAMTCFQLDYYYTSLSIKHSSKGKKRGGSSSTDHAGEPKQLKELMVPLRRIGECLQHLGCFALSIRVLHEYLSTALKAKSLGDQQEAYVVLDLAMLDWYESYDTPAEETRKLRANKKKPLIKDEGIRREVRNQLESIAAAQHAHGSARMMLLREAEFYSFNALDKAYKIASMGGAQRDGSPLTEPTRTVSSKYQERVGNAHNNLTNVLSAKIANQIAIDERLKRERNMKQEANKYTLEEPDAKLDALVASNSDFIPSICPSPPAATSSNLSLIGRTRARTGLIFRESSIPPSVRSDFTLAKSVLEQAILSAIASDNKMSRSRVLHSWGCIYESVGWMSEGQRKMEQSIEVLEDVSKFTSELLQDLLTSYISLITFYLKSFEYQPCMRIIERAEALLADHPFLVSGSEAIQEQQAILKRYREDLLRDVLPIQRKIETAEKRIEDARTRADLDALVDGLRYKARKCQVMGKVVACNARFYQEAVMDCYTDIIVAHRWKRKKEETEAGTAGQSEDGVTPMDIDSAPAVKADPDSEAATSTSSSSGHGSTHPSSAASALFHIESEAHMVGLLAQQACQVSEGMLIRQPDASLQLERLFIDTFFNRQRALYQLTDNKPLQAETLAHHADARDQMRLMREEGNKSEELEAIMRLREEAVEIAKQCTDEMEGEIEESEATMHDDENGETATSNTHAADLLSIHARRQQHAAMLTLQQELLAKLVSMMEDANDADDAESDELTPASSSDLTPPVHSLTQQGATPASAQAIDSTPASAATTSQSTSAMTSSAIGVISPTPQASVPAPTPDAPSVKADEDSSSVSGAITLQRSHHPSTDLTELDHVIKPDPDDSSTPKPTSTQLTPSIPARSTAACNAAPDSTPITSTPASAVIPTSTPVSAAAESSSASVSVPASTSASASVSASSTSGSRVSGRLAGRLATIRRLQQHQEFVRHRMTIVRDQQGERALDRIKELQERLEKAYRGEEQDSDNERLVQEEEMEGGEEEEEEASSSSASSDVEDDQLPLNQLHANSERDEQRRRQRQLDVAAAAAARAERKKRKPEKQKQKQAKAASKKRRRSRSRSRSVSPASNPVATNRPPIGDVESSSSSSSSSSASASSSDSDEQYEQPRSRTRTSGAGSAGIKNAIAAHAAAVRASVSAKPPSKHDKPPKPHPAHKARAPSSSPSSSPSPPGILPASYTRPLNAADDADMHAEDELGAYYDDADLGGLSPTSTGSDEEEERRYRESKPLLDIDDVDELDLPYDRRMPSKKRARKRSWHDDERTAREGASASASARYDRSPSRSYERYNDGGYRSYRHREYRSPRSHRHPHHRSGHRPRRPTVLQPSFYDFDDPFARLLHSSNARSRSRTATKSILKQYEGNKAAMQRIQQINARAAREERERKERLMRMEAQMRIQRQRLERAAAAHGAMTSRTTAGTSSSSVRPPDRAPMRVGLSGAVTVEDVDDDADDFLIDGNNMVQGTLPYRPSSSAQGQNVSTGSGSVSRSSTPTRPRSLQFPDLSLHIIRISITQPLMPSHAPKQLCFILEPLTSNHSIESLDEAMRQQRKRYPFKLLSNRATLAELATAVQQHLWEQSTLRCDLPHLLVPESNTSLPTSLQLIDAFPDRTKLDPLVYDSYRFKCQQEEKALPIPCKLEQNDATTPVGTPPVIVQARQKVIVHSLELIVPNIRFRQASMADAYDQYCQTLIDRPGHPDVLTLLRGNGSNSHEMLVPTSLVLDQPLAHVAAECVIPLILALRCDAGQLQRLHLSNVPMDEDACGRAMQAVLSAGSSAFSSIPPLSSLRELTLSFAYFSASVWCDLLPLFGSFSHLETLDLTETSVSDACLPALREAIRNPCMKNLRTLRLANCKEVSGEKDPATGAECLTANNQITSLTLDRTSLSHQCLVELFRRLQENKSLTCLSLNEIPAMMSPIDLSSLECPGAIRSHGGDCVATTPRCMHPDCVVDPFAAMVLGVPCSMRMSRAQLSYPADELRKGVDSVYDALYGFATTHTCQHELEGEEKRSGVKLYISGWRNPEAEVLPCLIDDIATNPRSRIQQIVMTGCNLNDEEKEFLKHVAKCSRETGRLLTHIEI